MCATIFMRKMMVCESVFFLKNAEKRNDDNLLICEIIRLTPIVDYSIYSACRPQFADPTQIFEYIFYSDSIIVGRDFNLHHPKFMQ